MSRSSSTSSSKSPSGRRSGSEDQSLICRVKYQNSMPEIPFPSKFLPYPFDPNRFVKYRPTSLEANHKHPLLAPTHVGCPVDLLDDEAYRPKDLDMHAKDEALCRPLERDDNKLRRIMEMNVPWLRKTEYISTENRVMGKAEATENKVLAANQDAITEASHYKDRASQIALIERTFESTRAKPRHPTNPDLEPVEILPVLPDFKLWCYNFYLGVFDDNPAPRHRDVPEGDHDEQLAQALLKGEAEYTSYFLPDQATLERRKRRRLGEEDADDDTPLMFSKVRDYTFNIQDKEIGSDDSFFFVIRPGEECAYNELPKKLRLSKRRRKDAGKRAKVTLQVTHRDWTQMELQSQAERLRMLKDVEEEDDDFDLDIEDAAADEGHALGEDGAGPAE